MRLLAFGQLWLQSSGTIASRTLSPVWLVLLHERCLVCLLEYIRSQAKCPPPPIPNGFTIATTKSKIHLFARRSGIKWGGGGLPKPEAFRSHPWYVSAVLSQEQWSVVPMYKTQP